MPLLRRQSFVKQKAPPDLDPEEEVFYCKLTGEIFRDYEKFFERIILCNSLVWTCELTGKPSLTYQEALDSETKAKKQLATLPENLQRPILYLVSQTHRTRLQDLNEDIFSFIKERYFIGENVEVIHKGERKPCKVVKVMAQGSGKQQNGAADSDNDSDVVCLDPPPPPKSPKSPKGSKASPAKSSPNDEQRSKTAWLEPNMYEYIVQEVAKPNIYIIKADQIIRKKGLYTREKSKLYLKQHCDPQGDGLWKVKPKYTRKFKLSETKFEDFFDGPKPTFVMSTVKRIRGRPPGGSVIDLTDETGSKQATKEQRKRKKQERDAAKEQKRIKKQKKEEIKAMEDAVQFKKMSPEERAALKEKIRQEKEVSRNAKREELKQQMEEEKLKRKEERDKEREKRKEEKRVRDEYLKEWSRPRDDLECDDLKDLPTLTPVSTHIPTDQFGDAVMVLEFLKCFETLLELKEVFPNGISFNDLSRSLMETDVNSLYGDLLRLLLVTLFQLREEEEEEEDLDQSFTDDKKLRALRAVNEGKASFKELVKAATIAVQKPQKTYGTALNKLPLDKFTMTEILRLHFLSSGSECSSKNIQFRYQQRGGYAATDDAGLEFCRQQGATLKAIGEKNVFDLGAGDKLGILKALIHQVLTYVASRDWVEDNFEKLKQVQSDLRHLRWADQRRDKDESAFWYKKRAEERARERELGAQKREQQKKEKAGDEAAPKDGEKDEAMEVDEGKQTKAEEKEKTAAERKSARTKEKQEKEKENEEMPVENIEWDKISPDERLSMKQRHAKKERDLVALVQKLQHGSAICPLGRDRTFRRYWVFQSIPGLFIEDQELHIPEDFLEPVKQAIRSNPLFHSDHLPLQAKAPSGESKSTSSDKENESLDHGKSVNLDVSDKDMDVVESVLTEQINLKAEGAVSALPDIDAAKDVVTSVSVHEQIAHRNSVRWAYLNGVEQLDRLLDNLNPRGYREGPLKLCLLEQRSRLAESVKQVPTQWLSMTKQDSSSEGKTGNPNSGLRVQSLKSGNKMKHGMVKNSSAEEFLELNLRESLLDLEDRIYAGSLGGIKVDNRNKWRDAIHEGSYDPQTQTLTWSGKQEDEPIRIPSPRKRVGAGDVGSDADAGVNGVDDPTPAIRDLARALVQIEQAIDAKYINPPLGEDEETKKNKQRAAVAAAFKGGKGKVKDKKGAKEKVKDKQDEEALSSSSDDDSDAESSEGRAPKTALERWEESLVAATSLSQVFLHLAVLEQSIIWSKSALHARCRICRRKGDGEHMLLCDGCDRGHHMYCLKPPVKQVPRGDWFCPDCRPKDIPKTPRKRRKSIFEEEVEEEAEEEEGEGDESGVTQGVDSDGEDMEASSDEEDGVEAQDADSDEDDDEDSDDDDSTEEEADTEEDEEEDDSPPQPAKIKFLKNAKKPVSSGRSTPNSIAASDKSKDKGTKGRRSHEPTASGGGGKATGSTGKAGGRGPGRPSLESKRGGRVTGRAAARHSLETDKPSSRGAKRSLDLNSGRNSRRSLDPATMGSKGVKRKMQLREEPVAKKALSSSIRGSEKEQVLKICEDLLIEVSQKSEAWPFLKPVSKRDAPDYFDVIKRPMDISTIRNKLNRYEYTNPADILEDLRLVFLNCASYNLPTAPEYQAGQKLSRFLEKRVRELKLDDLVGKVKSPRKGQGQGSSPSPAKKSQRRR